MQTIHDQAQYKRMKEKYQKITLLRVIPTMTCRVGVVRWGLLSTFKPHEALSIIGLHNWYCLHTFAVRSFWRSRSSETCVTDPHSD